MGFLLSTLLEILGHIVVNEQMMESRVPLVVTDPILICYDLSGWQYGPEVSWKKYKEIYYELNNN